MLYWIWLTQIKGVGPVRQRQLLERFITPENIYKVSFKELLQLLLYYKGNLIKNSTGVAIIGSRRCSTYGKDVVNEAANYLAKENIVVISEMAKGIDGYAHTSCIKANGYTIAILGNGLDICYPPEHIELMEKIIENGAIISEYPPGTRPNPKYYKGTGYHPNFVEGISRILWDAFFKYFIEKQKIVLTTQNNSFIL